MMRPRFCLHFRVVLPLLGLLLLAACQTRLDAGLTEQQANEEVALLLRHGIPASREADSKAGTLTVWVAQDRFADAVALLRANGLPKAHFDTVADVFNGNGLIVSPTAEHARLLYALGQELSQTISDIDGVLTAHVQIVMPNDDPLQRDPPPAAASVFVKYRPGSDVGALVPQIKMLVAGGVAGLAYDKVSVVLVPAALPRDATQPPQMQEVFGIWVYPGSAQTLRLLLAASAGMFSLLLCLAGRRAWVARHRLLRRVAGNSLVLR
jgi:type III secretion protein J